MQQVERIAEGRRVRRTVAHLSLLGVIVVGTGCAGGVNDSADRVDARAQRPSDAATRLGEFDESRSLGGVGRFGSTSAGRDGRGSSSGAVNARQAERLGLDGDQAGGATLDRDPVDEANGTTTTTLRDDEAPDDSTGTTTTTLRDDEVPTTSTTTTTIPR